MVLHAAGSGKEFRPPGEKTAARADEDPPPLRIWSMTAPIRPDDMVSQLGPLRRYAQTLTRDREAAEDLVQATMVRALERRATFRAGGSVRGWLFAILRNVFVDGRRSDRAGQAREAAVAGLRQEAVPAGQEGAVRLGQVRDAFHQLPEEQRAALHLVAIEGLSYRDAADALGIPQGTLMSRIGRARAALRALEDGVDAGARGDGAGVRLSVVGGTDDRSA